MTATPRAILIVLDSVGIGALPDAAEFGDSGTNTVGHIAERTEDFRLPHLEALGLGNIDPGILLPPAEHPQAAFGRAAEQSKGKDTTTGHWEIAGQILHEPFRTFPQGFPPELMEPFEARIGRGSLGNTTASGTVIINELGDEHVQSGKPIVYTSADSVFQVAAHESVIPVDELYRICEVARELCMGEFAVGRVIARPFIGESGNYTRTANRKDFSLQPPGATVLRLASDAGLKVKAVGKMNDIYAGDGITNYVKTKDNMDGVDRTLEYMAEADGGIIITNLVDFDMHFGHRRDVPGYAQCLREFDARLPEILAAMRPDDLLIITADHGNDPTHTGTDHTREYVPVLAIGEAVPAGQNLGTRATFADIGATLGHWLGLPPTEFGEPFLKLPQTVPS